MSLNFSYDKDEFDEAFGEEGANAFSLRENIIFLVDGAPQMYENNSPFLQCLKTYRNIVRQKCSRNKKDKMGLLAFGTIDKNCDVENVTVLQNLETVTIDALKNIQNILIEGDQKFKKMALDSKYSLYDVLTHACHLLQTSGASAKTSNIILLCTCNDNPCANDPVERRRIQHLIATFQDTRTELRVVGLSDTWSDDYYKDLQILSGTFSADDYKRIQLKDLEQTVLNASRSISSLPWKISPKNSIEVFLHVLVSSPKYPSKVKLEKNENEMVEARTVLQEKNINDLGDSEPSSSGLNEDTKLIKPSITSQSIMYYKVYAGANVYFTPDEVKKLKTLGMEPGIEILAFKPVAIDPLYHVKSPYFITYSSLSNDESKLFFKTFISKCYEKEVMAICKVVTRSTVLICTMIPSESDGGFYMYKLPFADMVRDLASQMPEFVFNPNKICKTNSKAVSAFKDLMDLSKIEFDIKKFTNPKLEKCIAHIEALALDEKLGSLPPDSTLPPRIKGDVKSLRDELANLLDLNTESKKRAGSQASSAAKRPRFDVADMASKGTLSSLTVADLKNYLQSVNQSKSGTKAALIKKINDYLGL